MEVSIEANFEMYCKTQGIKLEYTMPKTPKLNGKKHVVACKVAEIILGRGNVDDCLSYKQVSLNASKG